MDLKKNRRRFLGLAAKGTSLMGAMLAGLVPELDARAVTAMATTDSTTTTPDTPPLDPTTQATLYAQALNDPGVTMLVATLAEPGRVDPPAQSMSIVLSATVATQQVILPVISYASGSAIAYLIYGSGIASYNGVPLQVPVNALLSNTGQATFYVNGVLQDVTSTDPMPAMFAYFFPAEFATGLYTSQSSAQTVGTKAFGDFDRRFMRKVSLAYDGTTSGALSDSDPCVRIAGRNLDTCIAAANGAFYKALGAFGAAAFCIGWALVVVGTGGAAALSWAYFCGALVAAFAIATIAYKQDLAACETIFNGALAVCKRKRDRAAAT